MSVLEPGADGVEARELDGVEPLAQHRLERILPALLDVEPLPQPLCLGEAALLLPPGRVLALPDLRLQRGERLRARIEVGEAVPGLLRGVAGAALAFLQVLNGCAERVEGAFLRLELRGLLLQLVLDVGNLGRHRRGEARLLAVEALAPLRELLQRARMILAPRLDHPDRLLALGDTLLQFGRDGGGLLHGFVERRQRGRGSLLVGGGRLARRQRFFQCGLRRLAVAGERALLSGKRSQLLGQLGGLLRDTRFGFARERELLLEARDLGVRLVIARLLLVDGVARGVMIGAQRLETRLGRAHVGLQALERNGQIRNRGGMPVARRRGVLLLRKPQQLVHVLQPDLVLAIFGRDPRLGVELLELARELDPDVLDAREVVAGVGEPALGFLAPLLVLRDARGLLEEDAELLGLRLDHPRNHPLLDDRVGARAEAGAEEEIVDVAAANRDVVDVIGGIAVARQHALDRQLGVLSPLPADPPGAVVEDELDRRPADRLALASAIEDDVLHRLAAKRRRLRFTEHPADGVDDVRLAAAVRADDADELAGRADRGGVHERFEPGELDLGEAQWMTGERMSGGLCERPGSRCRSPRAGARLAGASHIR